MDSWAGVSLVKGLANAEEGHALWTSWQEGLFCLWWPLELDPQTGGDRTPSTNWVASPHHPSQAQMKSREQTHSQTHPAGAKGKARERAGLRWDSGGAVPPSLASALMSQVRGQLWLKARALRGVSLEAGPSGAGELPGPPRPGPWPPPGARPQRSLPSPPVPCLSVSPGPPLLLSPCPHLPLSLCLCFCLL